MLSFTEQIARLSDKVNKADGKKKNNFDFFKAPDLWQQKDGNAVWHVPST